MIFMGTSNIQDLKYGNINIDSAYWGSDLIWSKKKESSYNVFMAPTVLQDILRYNYNQIRKQVREIQLIDNYNNNNTYYNNQVNYLYFYGNEINNVFNDITYYKTINYGWDNDRKILFIEKPYLFNNKIIYYGHNSSIIPYTDNINMFGFCSNLLSISFLNYTKVINMSSFAWLCYNLENAECGEFTTNLCTAYYCCYNLKKAVCGNNVIDMSYSYENCYNLKNAVIGANVVNMQGAYRYCNNLRTPPIIESNVKDMSQAFYFCTQLTSAIIGNNVTNIYYAYCGCNNISGTTYIYSNNISNVFYWVTTKKGLNVYLYSNTLTANSFWNFYNNKNKNIWENNKGYDIPQYNLFFYYLDKI